MTRSRGRRAVCVSMGSRKGENRFLAFTNSVRGFFGLMRVAICHWSAGAGVVALGICQACQLGLCGLVLRHVEGSCYLRYFVESFVQGGVFIRVSLARRARKSRVEAHRLEVFAWHVYRMQIQHTPYGGATCGAVQWAIV